MNEIVYIDNELFYTKYASVTSDVDSVSSFYSNYSNPRITVKLELDIQTYPEYISFFEGKMNPSFGQNFKFEVRLQNYGCISGCFITSIKISYGIMYLDILGDYFIRKSKSERRDEIIEKILE